MRDVKHGWNTVNNVMERDRKGTEDEEKVL